MHFLKTVALSICLFRKFSIGLILLLCLYGCSSNSNKKTAIIDSVHHGVRAPKAKDTTAGNDTAGYENLSCNKLMISLIKTSSIDKDLLTLSDDERIDSIKNGSVYMTMYHENSENGSRNVGYLVLDMKKKELRIQDMSSDSTKKLEVNPKLLQLILQRDCYSGWVKDYGNNF